ncbi:MAG: LLM class F420-dependent oxidoreductase [Propionicimonas sp.]|uniref:LLM class F420-dependent oxidoreductase n=1 Tax=Propionicimonas sp. TaxID=1955623 RepID=UPI003D0E9B79
MQFGIHYPNFSTPSDAAALPATIATAARNAEQGGAAQFTLMDHYFQLDSMGGAAEPMLEGYTTLGFLAAQTERIPLGLLVTGVTYRHPGLLAKIVTTLDILSGGRAIFGIGAAWYEREHLGLGVRFPSLKERFERLEETLQIVLQMWSDDDGPYEGRHYQLAETINLPQVISRPHPPVLIGGAGERKTLRLVAQYGDACNLFSIGVDGVAAKLDVLRRHCDDVGRDYDTIQKTLMPGGDPLGATDAFVAEMERYAALGIELVTVMPRGEPASFVAEFAEKVAPRLAQLGPA